MTADFLTALAACETPEVLWLRDVAGPALDANRDAWAREDARFDEMERDEG